MPAPSFWKMVLSGSTDGLPIPVTATSGTGTTIHTATTSTSTEGNEMDEVWLWAANFALSVETLGVQIGNADENRKITTAISPFPAGATPVVMGWPVRNSVVVRATASIASAITVLGYAVRHSRSSY